LTEPGEEQAAESLIVGKTKLIADNRANSILVIGQPEAKDKVKAILTKLDKKPMQVYLATVIGQLTLNNTDEFAANILQKYIGGPQTGAASVAGGRPGAGKFNYGTTSYGTDVDGNPTTQTQSGTTPVTKQAAQQMANIAQMATGALPGMQIATFILGSIDLYIYALTQTNRFRIASRPAVFTANNKKATIYSGKKIAVPTSTVTTLGGGGSATATSGSQQSNIQYQDVVLKIEVVPLINSAKEISLQIVQTNDNIAPGQSQNVGGGVVVPDILTQELNTTVIVPDRATVLLGGLVTQQDAKNVAGVPFLSTIPLMGNLFKSTSDTTNRQELVVMIQPTVVLDNKELDEASKTERDLTGFSAKELQPLTMKSGLKSKDLGLQAAGTDSVPADEPKQE
jgi:type II secretory pathway component GspD/PulD (secretin)